MTVLGEFVIRDSRPTVNSKVDEDGKQLHMHDVIKNSVYIKSKTIL